jgi:HAE1 family hydrophobic/amphiphilic exporter-1
MSFITWQYLIFLPLVLILYWQLPGRWRLFLLLAASAYLFVIIPKDFIPAQDTGRIFGFTEASQDISFESMVRHPQAGAAVGAQDPAV